MYKYDPLYFYLLGRYTNCVAIVALESFEAHPPPSGVSGFSVRLRLLWAYRDSSSSSWFSRRLLVPRLVRRLLVARILLWLVGLLRRSFVCSRVDFANSRDLQLDEKAV